VSSAGRLIPRPPEIGLSADRKIAHDADDAAPAAAYGRCDRQHDKEE